MPKTKRLDDEQEIDRKKRLVVLDEDDEDDDGDLDDEDEDDDDTDDDDSDLDDEDDDDSDLDDVRPQASDRHRPPAKPRAGKPRPRAAGDSQSKRASPAAPNPASGVVPDSDPELRNLLHRAVTDGAAGPAFADWLEARNDPRANAVRDLFAPVAAIPPRPDDDGLRPMAAGQQWAVFRNKVSVTAVAHLGTPLYQLMLATEGPLATQVRIAASRQTPEVLAEAFQTCRLRFLLALFGTTLPKVAAERVVRDTTGVVADVLAVLRRVRLAAVPWLCALRTSHPSWYSEVMSHALRDPRLRVVCDAVLDAVDAGWREKLLAVGGNKS